MLKGDKTPTAPVDDPCEFPGCPYPGVFDSRGGVKYCSQHGWKASLADMRREFTGVPKGYGKRCNEMAQAMLEDLSPRAPGVWGEDAVKYLHEEFGCPRGCEGHGE